MPYRLSIHDGRYDRVLAVNDPLLTVGSASACGLRIESEGVAKRHALLRQYGKCVVVEDLGARDGAGWAMLGKTFKGLTDETLRWQTEALLAREVARDGHVVQVRPELVVEIEFNDVQRSARYPSGLALRHARVVRYRDDKRAVDADAIEAVWAIARADGVVPE